MQNLTPDIMELGYRQGIFPMAESRNAPEVFWVSPERRGVLPLEGFHISRSLGRRLRRGGFSFALDQRFEAVIDGCAAREETWINPMIRRAYSALYARGMAHSAEIYAEDRLVGGVFGIAIGGAFFGESMFSQATDASKAALALLCRHLAARGFTLFDTQYLTPHLASLGAVELPRAAYLRRLAPALRVSADFGPPAPPQPTA